MERWGPDWGGTEAETSIAAQKQGKDAVSIERELAAARKKGGFIVNGWGADAVPKEVCGTRSRAKAEHHILKLPYEMSAMLQQKEFRSVVPHCPTNGDHSGLLLKGTWKVFPDGFRKYYPTAEEEWPQEKPVYFTEDGFETFTGIYKSLHENTEHAGNGVVTLNPAQCECQAIERFHKQSFVPWLYFLECDGDEGSYYDEVFVSP